MTVRSALLPPRPQPRRRQHPSCRLPVRMHVSGSKPHRFARNECQYGCDGRSVGFREGQSRHPRGDTQQCMPPPGYDDADAGWRVGVGRYVSRRAWRWGGPEPPTRSSLPIGTRRAFRPLTSGDCLSSVAAGCTAAIDGQARLHARPVLPSPSRSRRKPTVV